MKTMLKKWFTLVELIVVITILAILGTIAFTAFDGMGGKAETVAAKTSLQQFAANLDSYKNANGKLPAAYDADNVDPINGSGNNGYGKIGVLGNKSSFAATMKDATVDDNGVFVIGGRKIFYAVDAQGEYYALGTMVNDKLVINSNYPIYDADKTNLFGLVKGSINAPNVTDVVANLIRAENQIDGTTKVFFAAGTDGTLSTTSIPAVDTDTDNDGVQTFTPWLAVDTEVTSGTFTTYVKGTGLQY